MGSSCGARSGFSGGGGAAGSAGVVGFSFSFSLRRNSRCRVFSLSPVRSDFWRVTAGLLTAAVGVGLVTWGAGAGVDFLVIAGAVVGRFGRVVCGVGLEVGGFLGLTVGTGLGFAVVVAGMGLLTFSVDSCFSGSSGLPFSSNRDRVGKLA